MVLFLMCGSSVNSWLIQETDDILMKAAALSRHF